MKDLSMYQPLGEGQRFVTAEDGLCEDTQVAVINGIGCQYEIHQQMPEGYRVFMTPFGPMGLRGVVQGEGLTWIEAMDHVRDTVQRELDDELSAEQ